MTRWMTRTTRGALVGFTGLAFLALPAMVCGQMDGNANAPGGSNMSAPAGQSGMQGQQPGQAGTSGTPLSNGSSLGAPGQTGQQMMDRQFMQKAAMGGNSEVKLGMLAAQKGGPEVKVFGQKMVDDHTAMNKSMARVADEMGVMLPKKINKEDQAEYDKLSGLSGDDFDKEYILYMVKDHREDMHEFRAEAAVAAEPGLEAEVTKDAGIIREHLMMITKMAQDKGVALPPRPPRPAAPPAK